MLNKNHIFLYCLGVFLLTSFLIKISLGIAYANTAGGVVSRNISNNIDIILNKKNSSIEEHYGYERRTIMPARNAPNVIKDINSKLEIHRNPQEQEPHSSFNLAIPSKEKSSVRTSNVHNVNPKPKAATKSSSNTNKSVTSTQQTQAKNPVVNNTKVQEEKANEQATNVVPAQSDNSKSVQQDQVKEVIEPSIKTSEVFIEDIQNYKDTEQEPKSDNIPSQDLPQDSAPSSTVKSSTYYYLGSNEKNTPEETNVDNSSETNDLYQELGIYDNNDFEYEDTLNRIIASNELYVKGLELEEVDLLVKKMIYANQFRPYVTYASDVITGFPDNTMYGDTLPLINKVMLLSSAITAIKDPNKGSSYKYAYVDMFLQAPNFENISIEKKEGIENSQDLSGNFYEVIDKKNNKSDVIFIEHGADIQQLPKEFLLQYNHNSKVAYSQNNKNEIVPHFIFIKPLTLNNNLAPQHLYSLNIQCKSYFSGGLINKRLNENNTDNSQLGLKGICSSTGNDILYNAVINKSIILDKEEMKEYLNFLLLRNNVNVELVRGELEFLKENYLNLHNRYQDAYYQSIDTIEQSSVIIKEMLSRY